MTCKALCIVIFTLCVATVVQATIKNLGTVGKTYPVIEPDILVELQQQAIQKGALSQEQMLERMRNYQPKQLYKLPRATADKTFLVNMTYTLDRDLADAQGKVIYPRGYTFNPLDYTTLPGDIVVIDGDDPQQMKWFKTSPYFKNHQARLLISNGHAFDLVEQLQRPVFYLTDDIARRLQLGAVPSLVIQQGDKMQVREFYLPPGKQGKVNGDQ
ncbi:hypothetical protein KKC22_20670 [Myxococcota bacterium]|nr:hypothetical protein [Myxococcota bacterium]